MASIFGLPLPPMPRAVEPTCDNMQPAYRWRNDLLQILSITEGCVSYPAVEQKTPM